MGEIIKDVRKNVHTELGIHAHNDSGMAISLSVLAVLNGVSQVQGTFVSYGERCGNANRSAIIANLELKRNVKCLPDGNIKDLTNTARAVAEISNFKLLST
jgi:2-isopropylmalate synthase